MGERADKNKENWFLNRSNMNNTQFFKVDNPTVVSSNRILYTASPFARNSLLHLQEIGELQAKREHTSERAGLDSFLFFTVVSGSGALMYDGHTYHLERGDCVFLNCRYSYAHTTDPNDLWTLKWTHFYGPGMQAVYDKYVERGGRPVFSFETASQQAQVGDVWSELMSIAASDDYMRDMKINSLLSRLILYIMEQSWHPEDKKRAPKRSGVADVRNFLDGHFAEKISLDGLSRDFYIDKYYLAKTFKAQYGQTISTYLLALRITRAKQLLRFSDKTVEEIGCEVGIDNPAYFSRVFKEIEGVSPRTYRDSW